MKPIIIQDPKNLHDIEEAISTIGSNPGISIQLPIDSINKKRGALYDGSRLQMLVTWARHSKESLLSFHEASSVDSVLEKLCDYSPGLSALRIADGIKVGDKVITRRDALLPAANKMQATDNEDYMGIIHGRTIDLICVSGSKVQYLRPLFNSRSSDSVKSKSDMQKLMQTLADKINQYDKNLIPTSLINALGIFTNELFENTQEHAISDFEGTPYSSHVEGLIISWKQIDENQNHYSHDFDSHPDLKNFWNRELKISGNTTIKTSLRCLQLSFFDSGPGLASRRSGKKISSLSLEEERDFLIECLQTRTTTKDQSGAGLGLPNVLAELNNVGGLIRIRSGRHSIFNTFPQDLNLTNAFDFKDWGESNLGAVEGALVTLLIPLRKK